MTTETVLTDAQIFDCFDRECAEMVINFDADELYPVGRAIERAVLQSSEVQQMRKDAERYLWLKKRMLAVDFEYGDPPCIALVFLMPKRGMVFSAGCDSNIDLGMEQEP